MTPELHLYSIKGDGPNETKMNPVERYREPGRVVQKFRDVQMAQEFQKWVDLVQPILEMHNIQPSEPIHVDLPHFQFKTETSLANRINRLNMTAPSELNVKPLKLDEFEAEQHFQVPAPVIVTEPTPVTFTTASVELTETAPKVTETTPVAFTETAVKVTETAPVAFTETAVKVTETASVAVTETAPITFTEPAPVAVTETAPVTFTEPTPVTVTEPTPVTVTFTESTPVTVTEPIEPVKRVAPSYNDHESPEINFQRWAHYAHPNESLMSFIPLHLDTTQTMSEIFNANTAHVDNLGALRDYFFAATSNTSDLSQSITFMDGISKHIDNEMLFTDDNAAERTLNTLMNSQKSLYFIEYLN